MFEIVVCSKVPFQNTISRKHKNRNPSSASEFVSSTNGMIVLGVCGALVGITVAAVVGRKVVARKRASAPPSGTSEEEELPTKADEDSY